MTNSPQMIAVPDKIFTVVRAIKMFQCFQKLTHLNFMIKLLFKYYLIFFNRMGIRAAPFEPLRWYKCGEFDCTKIELPIDHFDPNSKTFHTGIVKYPAKMQPAEKTIVLNFGASGQRTVLNFGKLFSMALNEKVDIIGFDARGVGMTAIDCRDLTNGDDYLDELQKTGLFATPINPHDSQLAHYDSLIQRFAYNCRRNTGDFLNYISTANVARDLDHIRRELGLEQLNLWSMELGSVLGLTYANLFPERVGSFILESIPNINSYFNHFLEYISI
jgi:pimeloyl-ACP methyl ester carboxylesterase